ncbi:hypothetical protein TNCV_4520871 [Trichonephila clavipes]|nr:hypothetical protein TNCV_4520871 [Trichonephila clavipes]
MTLSLDRFKQASTSPTQRVFSGTRTRTRNTPAAIVTITTKLLQPNHHYVKTQTGRRIKLSNCRSLPNDQRDANRTINLNLLRTPSTYLMASGWKYTRIYNPQRAPKSISDKVPYRSVTSYVKLRHVCFY